MKIVVIGSVAAGTSVAAKARRNNEKVDCKINPNAIRTKKISFL